MTYALVDNASLTAVQRVFGDVAIKGPDTINGDLVALENVVQALLFYDEVICLDNYKAEHRKSRAAAFPFIRFIDPTVMSVSPFEEAAKTEAKLIRPEIRGGEFADADFKEFFQLLKMNIICTWDMHASTFYLTMKMLGQPGTNEYEKYGELSAAIFSELADFGQTRGRWSDKVDLVGSNGVVHEQKPQNAGGYGGTTRALDVFVASLNWIAYKTIYYSLFAKHLHADTFLHPIRHAFQIHWMKKSGVYGHDFTAKLVAAMGKDIRSAIDHISDKGRASTVSVDLPLFSAYLASEAADVRQVLKAALDLRTRAEIVQIRQLLREIRLEFDQSELGKANKKIAAWEAELEKASAAAKSKFGIKTPQGIPVSPIITVYNVIAALKGLARFPDIKTRIPLPDVLKSGLTNSFGTLYKSVIKELTTMERLGSLRDLLAKRFSYEEGWDDRYLPPKTEDPKFRHVKSHWKEPM